MDFGKIRYDGKRWISEKLGKRSSATKIRCDINLLISHIGLTNMQWNDYIEPVARDFGKKHDDKR